MESNKRIEMNLFTKQNRRCRKQSDGYRRKRGREGERGKERRGKRKKEAKKEKTLYSGSPEKNTDSQVK